MKRKPETGDFIAIFSKSDFQVLEILGYSMYIIFTTNQKSDSCNFVIHKNRLKDKDVLLLKSN